MALVSRMHPRVAVEKLEIMLDHNPKTMKETWSLAPALGELLRVVYSSGATKTLELTFGPKDPVFVGTVLSIAPSASTLQSIVCASFFRPDAYRLDASWLAFAVFHPRRAALRSVELTSLLRDGWGDTEAQYLEEVVRSHTPLRAVIAAVVGTRLRATVGGAVCCGVFSREDYDSEVDKRSAAAHIGELAALSSFSFQVGDSISHVADPATLRLFAGTSSRESLDLHGVAFTREKLREFLLASPRLTSLKLQSCTVESIEPLVRLHVGKSPDCSCALSVLALRDVRFSRPDASFAPLFDALLQPTHRLFTRLLEFEIDLSTLSVSVEAANIHQLVRVFQQPLALMRRVTIITGDVPAHVVNEHIEPLHGCLFVKLPHDARSGGDATRAELEFVGEPPRLLIAWENSLFQDDLVLGMNPALQHKRHPVGMLRWQHADPMRLFMVLAACLAGHALAFEKLNAASVLNTTAKIHVAPSIAAVLGIIVGLFVCFSGFKLLRPVVFLSGFIVGGLIIALVIEYAFASAPWMATASWIGFLVAGVITGSMTLMLYNVGLFLVGALAGILLAFTLNTSVAYRIYPSQPDIILVILIVVLGLLFGVLAWKLEKPLVVVATSFIGATAVVWGVGYFAGKYPSGADLKRFRFKDATGAWIYGIPSAWWGYLAANVLLFALGIYVQYRKTSPGSSTSSRTVTRSPSYRQPVSPQSSFARTV